MIKTWAELLGHLGIEPHNLGRMQIDKLTNWCQKNISEEVMFTGSDKDCSTEIEIYVRQYFNMIHASSSGDLASNHALLDDNNCIQFAALHGYDQYLAELLPVIKNVEKIVNNPTSVGNTPLHLSALNGHKKSTMLLLSHQANVSVKNHLNQTPLHFSLTASMLRSETVKSRKHDIFNLLIASKPEIINATDTNGTTVAHLASENEFFDVLVQLKNQHLGLLLQKNGFNHSCLHIALLNNRKDAVKLLSTIPELLEIKDGSGKKPIHYAASCADINLISYCLSLVNINEIDGHKQTPLHYAVMSGKLDAVKFLMEKGADVSIKDFRGFGFFHYALDSPNKDIMDLFEETSKSQAGGSLS